jgi:hypothetical protein
MEILKIFIVNLQYNISTKSYFSAINASCVISSQNPCFFCRTGISNVDSADNMYVTDLNNHRIQKFDSNGNFITTLGSVDKGDSQFNSPPGIAVDSYGRVYVTYNRNSRIQVFASSLDTTNNSIITSKNNPSVGYNQTTVIIPMNKTSSLTNNATASNAKNITISLPPPHAGISDQF